MDPPVWRRLVVPEATSFRGLHHVLQAAMGWQNSHLYEFQLGGARIGRPNLEFDDGEVIDAAGIRLRDVPLDRGATLVYLYDFGDGWEHLLEIEDVLAPPEAAARPACLDGARACPPEDCGGPYGYGELLEALADPDHPENEDLAEWVGDGFDPERFDLETADSLVGHVRP